MSQVITRFAPSPTGYLHIGGARTALFNWLLARHYGGKFFLRIEDTDAARSTKEAVDALLQGLKWLGLDWDGEPVYQASRASRHAEVAHQLLAAGKAYRCYTTQAELETFRAANPKAKYRSPWRPPFVPPASGVDNTKTALSACGVDNSETVPPACGGDVRGGTPYVIRLSAPLTGSITVRDHVRGEVQVAAEELDDMVLLRADGTPTYMLAVVVDDHDMGITHVVRGDDHFTNTFRQTLLYDALGWSMPEFAHIPLIHGADGAKLSKRHGALGVEQYESMGYLPEAMRNYLLRLGWSHGDDEFISSEQAIAWFTLEGIGNSPSRLDIEKLNHVNHHYMKLALPERLLALLPFEDGHDILLGAIPWLVERAQTLVELGEQAAFLVAPLPLAYSEKAQALITSPEAQAMLAGILTRLEAPSCREDWQAASLKALCDHYMQEKSLKPKQFMPVMRAALSGKEASAGTIFQIMAALGSDNSCARIRDATIRGA